MDADEIYNYGKLRALYFDRLVKAFGLASEAFIDLSMSVEEADKVMDRLGKLDCHLDIRVESCEHHED